MKSNDSHEFLFQICFDPTCDRACSLPTVGKVKHSFFGLSQPESKCFTPPWGPEILACGNSCNLAAFRLATIYETHLEVFNALEIVCLGVPGEVNCTSGALAPAFVIEHALCVSNMHMIARDMLKFEHAC